MSRRFKICAILLSIVLVSFAAASIGMTAAIWAGAGGEANTYGPNPISTDWNSWKKYFVAEEYTYTYNSQQVTGAIITGFTATNLEDVIFPDSVSLNGTETKVIAIANTVFASSTLKALPVTISISPSVLYIQDSAFANLHNLQQVRFGVYREGEGINRPIIQLGNFAFMGCTSLSQSTGIVNDGRTLSYANEANCYLGTLA